MKRTEWTVFKIVTYPDMKLKQACRKIPLPGDEEKGILRDMLKTMYMNDGIGLAAPQVGIQLQLAVVDIGDKKVVRLINPDLIEAEGAETMEEGCLSIPGVYVNVKRASRIKISTIDENGKEKTIEASGLLARAILHEMDHLNGRLIIDYLNPVKRFIAMKKR